MASIFTWEPDTPRVSSPWLHNASDSDGQAARSNTGRSADQSSRKITRLQAEPQEGPIEYKLHLLLRPRRKFRVLSTGTLVPGSRRSSTNDSDGGVVSNPNRLPPANPASTQQTRQHRLEQLTTQLLWRLQQSSPHHTSSATNIILPSLPEALPELLAPQQPGKVLHGLEESEGALYEIGVSDDGTLVGLAEDELQESLNNLRAMAACLGCTIQVLRTQNVGYCEWSEEDANKERKGFALRHGPLFVAEALVKPHLQAHDGDLAVQILTQKTANLAFAAAEQLRITLTGPTMSGKSTLLGTLTTSTLDSGRGKSRLTLLKHRHEITSGITSSVTQELFGYQDLPDGGVEVVNYATDNVASWIDIHAASAGARLVFVSDSAGHPRYRRTTVRSLIGWAPHWTLFCVPANDDDDSSNDVSRDMDLAEAQLDLCLRLALPLVIVITKLDLASRSSLKFTLSKVLDALKAAGRQPSILPNSPEDHFTRVVDSTLVDKACNLVVPLLNDPIRTVPIILTSAVQGTGISNLHALLHELPIPASTQGNTPVFHVEDMYSKPAEVTGLIVSGHLFSGEIAVSDELVLGPFSTHDNSDDSDSEEIGLTRPSATLTTSRSFPGALHVRKLPSPRYTLPGQEWKRVVVTSIRNLRLPTHALHAGQVGTLAIMPVADNGHDALTVLGRIRKGMVLTPIPPATIRTFVAEFDRDDLAATSVGNTVIVYIASIRAAAKIISARAPDRPVDDSTASVAPFDFEDDTLSDDKQHGQVSGTVTAPTLQVTIAFESTREFVMLNDKVLVMPGGGPTLSTKHERGRKGLTALDGFVGRIVELVG